MGNSTTSLSNFSNSIEPEQIQQVFTKMKEKIRFENFDFKLFQKEVQERENKRGDVPLKRFEKLPILNGKYKIICIIGNGAFGKVLKVKDIYTNKFFALKTLPLAGNDKNKESNSDMDSASIFESAKTEIELLPQLKNHPNIVKYHDSFMLNRDPLVAKPSENSNVHVCVAMEYIKGSDLDLLLSFSEKNKFSVGGSLAIKWFLLLLKAIAHCHEMGIVHRDLKPDNFLIKYDNLDKAKEERDKMKIKITDFGVAKKFSSTKETLNGVKGHIFYSAEEVLSKDKYGAKCDVFSLSIIFMQLIFGFCTKTYENEVNRVFAIIKNDPKLNKKYCERFNQETILEGTTYVKLMIFTHEENLFGTKFVDNLFGSQTIKLTAIKTIVDLMSCEESKRLSTKELLDHNIIKGWDFIIKNHMSLEMVNSKEILDFKSAGIITFLRISTTEAEIGVLEFSIRCLNIYMQKTKQEGVKEVFKNCGGRLKFLQIVMTKFILYQGFRKIVPQIISLLLTTIQYDELPGANDFLDELSYNVRKYQLTDLLKDLVLSDNYCDANVLAFVALLIKQSSTIKQMFLEMIEDFILLLVESEEQFQIDTIISIIEELSSFVDDSDIIDGIFNIYKDEDILFLKNVSPNVLKSNLDVSKVFFNRILKSLDSLVKNEDKDEDILQYCDMLLFQITKTKEKKINLNFDDRYKCKNMLISTNLEYAEIDAQNEIDVADEETMKLSDEFEKHVTIKSEELICTLSEQAKREDEFIVGFYECLVIDGGLFDSFEIGITFDDTSVAIDAKGNLIKRKQGKVTKTKKFNQRYPFSSGVWIGIGVSNNAKLVFIYNKELIYPMIDLDVDKTEKKVFGYILISENYELNLKLNFGEFLFTNTFLNEKEELKDFTNAREIVKSLDLKVLKSIKEENKGLKGKYASKILEVLGKQGTEGIVEESEILHFHKKSKNMLFSSFCKLHSLKFLENILQGENEEEEEEEEEDRELSNEGENENEKELKKEGGKVPRESYFRNKSAPQIPEKK